MDPLMEFLTEPSDNAQTGEEKVASFVSNTQFYARLRTAGMAQENIEGSAPETPPAEVEKEAGLAQDLAKQQLRAALATGGSNAVPTQQAAIAAKKVMPAKADAAALQRRLEAMKQSRMAAARRGAPKIGLEGAPKAPKLKFKKQAGVPGLGALGNLIKGTYRAARHPIQTAKKIDRWRQGADASAAGDLAYRMGELGSLSKSLRSGLTGGKAPLMSLVPATKRRGARRLGIQADRLLGAAGLNISDKALEQALSSMPRSALARLLQRGDAARAAKAKRTRNLLMGAGLGGAGVIGARKALNSEE